MCSPLSLRKRRKGNAFHKFMHKWLANTHLSYKVLIFYGIFYVYGLCKIFFPFHNCWRAFPINGSYMNKLFILLSSLHYTEACLLNSKWWEKEAFPAMLLLWFTEKMANPSFLKELRWLFEILILCIIIYDYISHLAVLSPRYLIAGLRRAKAVSNSQAPEQLFENYFF